MGQLKITVTIDEDTEGRIYQYLSNTTIRRRATMLLDLAMKRLDQEHALGLLPIVGSMVNAIDPLQKPLDNAGSMQNGHPSVVEGDDTQLKQSAVNKALSKSSFI